MNARTVAMRAQAAALRAWAASLEVQADELEQRVRDDHRYEPTRLLGAALKSAPQVVKSRDSIQQCSKCGCLRSGPSPWLFFNGAKWTSTKPACSQ